MFKINTNTNYIQTEYFDIHNGELVDIDQLALSLNNVTTLEIPEGVTEIVAEIPEFITHIKLPTTLTKFYYNEFAKSRIAEFDMYNTKITNIPSNIFQNNRYVETIILPKNVKEVERDAFNKCLKLTHLYIPSTVDYVAPSALAGTIRLKAIMTDNAEVLRPKLPSRIKIEEV